MRIIAGKYRGTNIPSPKEEIVKPTLDRVKENIFNILQFQVQDSVCLDLFCGSGALGLECLSRNAKEVYFVDNNKKNITALKNLLTKLNATDYILSSSDYYEALKQFSGEKKQFDIIFLDPPYDTDLAEVALQKIFKFNLLSPTGVVVWEHPTDYENLKFKSKVKNTKVYGKVQIDFLA
ncbi:MAG: 16S rRNA (guanine(966)-N(2))-methyltransferase RsmD [Clostridia bacterium]|nr:16S rRNA (guanine(966)-N(2))-methyltransferase RsmD [Clostridia bacterium]